MNAPGAAAASGWPPPRTLGIDYGRKRLGLAVTDPLGIAAHPLPGLRHPGELPALLAALAEVIAEREIEHLVVGLPLNMDGTRGPMAREVERFAAQLAEATGLPLELVDERLSTREADERLAAAGMHWRRRKRHRDQVSAAILLGEWLERRRRRAGAAREPG
ncbi:MAG: putative pre-16S rRNA nuclease [Planctomycetota bacterium]|nr:MAG: putative pre-16S rRNA nuclease [Planctomycetota bacterium]